jgi:pimeloyl-ACP methyl ester carboxylesterase
MGSKQSACAECKVVGVNSNCPPTEQGGCGRSLCSKCLRFALITQADANVAKDVFLIEPRAFCWPCMLTHTNIDFKKTEDVFEAKGETKGYVLFVHGGGGNRLMFAPHARALAEKSFKCVLMDLPGHASRLDEQLSMNSACACISAVYAEHFGAVGDKKVCYVGGSLGGYIGMEMLGRYPHLFSGAVIAMCGQDVGSGMSLYLFFISKCS